MKLIKKSIYILWSIFIALVLILHCFSAYIGYKVKQIAVSSIESYGTDYGEYDNIIDDYNYIRLWHERFDTASFDETEIKEKGKTQKYALSYPYIMFFKDKNNFFSCSKVGYIYDSHIIDKDGKETTVAALPKSKVILDLKFDGLKFKIDNVTYDNDFDEYAVNPHLNGLFLAVILLINSFVRNIRYFDHCVKFKKKKNAFTLFQPYIFVLLIILAMIFDLLYLALIIGITEELIFTVLSAVLRKCKK